MGEKIKLNQQYLVPMILIVITLLGMVMRFWRLDEIPGEIFGDISENLRHIHSILTGNWHLIYGYDGREALLFYLAAPLTRLFGNTYINLKITVALIGTLSIPLLYLFGKELYNKRTGLILAFLIAVSKWPVIFSRIGFRTILTPLFVALTLFFFLRAHKQKKLLYFILTGIALGFGWYTYPSFKFMPPIAILIFAILIWKMKEKMFYVKGLLTTIGVFLIFLIPMVLDFKANPTIYTSHIGPMMLKDGHLRPDWFPVLLMNIKNQALMYHVKGDIVFRVNPTNQPQLDILSGIFFLIGIAFSFLKRKKETVLFIYLPFIILQLPSLLVLNVPIDIPSATRLTAIIPFVYLFVSLGLIFVLDKLKVKYLRAAFLGLSLAIIFGINFYYYFHDYRLGLPDNNTPTGRIIAQQIDAAPAGYTTVVVGCCWGAWGQPEPGGISYAMRSTHEVQFTQEHYEYELCATEKTGKKMLWIISPEYINDIRYYSCFSDKTFYVQKNAFGTVLYYWYKH